MVAFPGLGFGESLLAGVSALARRCRGWRMLIGPQPWLVVIMRNLGQ